MKYVQTNLIDYFFKRNNVSVSEYFVKYRIRSLLNGVILTELRYNNCLIN